MTDAPMKITITPAAEKFMRRMVRFSGARAGAGFRLTVAPGGCSGVSSEFTVEAQPLPGDAALDVNGLAVFLPAQSRLLLEGATVDFADTAVSSGLSFNLAKADGCGSCSTVGAPAVAKVDLASIARRP
jgi:iron-sulfur cluster assembly accessory protein